MREYRLGVYVFLISDFELSEKCIDSFFDFLKRAKKKL